MTGRGEVDGDSGQEPARTSARTALRERTARRARSSDTPEVRSGTVVPIQAARAPDHDDLILLRVPVTSPVWAEGLPPVPNALIVTVTFSDPEVEAEHAEPLELLGYVGVGCRSAVAAAEEAEGAVDLLLTRTACNQFPRWRDQLLASGGRVWDLSLGPVRRILGDAVAMHLDHLTR